MSSRMLLFAGLAALVVGLAGCGATVAWGVANSAPQGGMMGGGMMGGGMMGGGMMGGGMMGGSTMVWSQGAGPVSRPQDALPAALATVRGHGWDWLTVDEVHIFPAFYEVEFNDRAGFKGPEVYVNRSSGDVGPEMGPNMMWDSGVRCSGACGQGHLPCLGGRGAAPRLLGVRAQEGRRGRQSDQRPGLHRRRHQRADVAAGHARDVRAERVAGERLPEATGHDGKRPVPRRWRLRLRRVCADANRGVGPRLPGPDESGGRTATLDEPAVARAPLQ